VLASVQTVKQTDGKTAFITGGASGIGFGIAQSFVGAGMNVVLADLRQDHIDWALGEFGTACAAKVHGIRLDVTDRLAMSSAAEEAESRFGNLHIIVNNAGVGIQGPLLEASYDDWDFGLAVNLGGVINGLQTFLPRIRRHGEGGHVVNTASLAALVTMPANMAMYVTAKAAVVALTESIRTELAHEGIGVTLLCPGPVKSNIHELERNRPERFTSSGGFQAAAKRLGARSASHMWMDPNEVGMLVLRAVRDNVLYVITHAEWRSAVVTRCDALLAAMPQTINPDLLRSLRAN
jgi:NAD(P)-dependent dehydrogenase (short-subunit alcohol dehydrogenase family)